MPILRQETAGTGAALNTKFSFMPRLFGKVKKPQAIPTTPKIQTQAPPSTNPPSTARSPAPVRQASHNTASSSGPRESSALVTGRGVLSAGSSSEATFSPRPSILPAVRNAFAGQLHTPAKRSASPINGRHQKMARLGLRGDLDELKQDLGHKLVQCKNELKAEFQAEIKQLREDLKASEERSKARSCLLKTDLGTLKTDLGTLKSDLGILTADIGSCETHLGTLKADLGGYQAQLELDQAERRTAAESSREQIKEVKVSMERRYKAIGEKLNTLETGLGTKVQQLTEHITALVAKPVSRPEEEGYLAESCPAPPGENQREYESRIFRACLSYVYSL